jgi:hypothetical protein
VGKGTFYQLPVSSFAVGRRLSDLDLPFNAFSSEISFNNHQLESHHHELPSACAASVEVVSITIYYLGQSHSSFTATFLSLVVATNALRICHCGSRVHPMSGYASKSLADPLLSSTSMQSTRYHDTHTIHRPCTLSVVNYSYCRGGDLLRHPRILADRVDHFAVADAHPELSSTFNSQPVQSLLNLASPLRSLAEPLSTFNIGP